MSHSASPQSASANKSSSSGLSLQCPIATTPTSLRLQPKLTINTPGDKYEQEADRVADQVTRMPKPIVQDSIRYASAGIQRKSMKKNAPTPRKKPKVQENNIENMDLVIREMVNAGITDNQAIANVLANIEAESHFTPKTESLKYRPDALAKSFPKHVKNLQEAKALTKDGEESVGNRVYGGRMGNAPQEGFKYRGRGLIQITGRSTYEALGKAIGDEKLAEHPDNANDLAKAAKIVPQFFLTFKKLKMKDLSDIDKVNKAVGFNDDPKTHAEGGRRKERAKYFLEMLNARNAKTKDRANTLPWITPDSTSDKPFLCCKSDSSCGLTQGDSAAGMIAPPIVNDVLNSSGSPLPTSTRSFMESRFGQDFSHVRVHTNQRAVESAAAVNARAYTVGSSVVFGRGESPSSDQRLLAHELTHVVQQSAEGSSIQRQSVDLEHRVSSPADLAQGRYKVIVVGSPGAAEVKSGHPYQFADAAANIGADKNTVWLVERSGYERGKVDLGGVSSRAGMAHVFWIDESTSLASLLNQFPSHTIESLKAFSHGFPGLLALRHGWDGVKDYGMTAEQARGLSPRAFTSDSRISFDSCNSAIGGRESIAQSVADATQRPVHGWTGRTSYRAVNRGEGGVRGSEIFPGDSLVPDWKEIGSQTIGRHPEFIQVAPTSSPGDFSSTYAITARLPESRHFPVMQGQRVSVEIDADSDIPILNGYQIWAVLHRTVPNWFDNVVGESRQFKIGSGKASFSWENLDAGDYYLEIYHLHGVLVTGNIKVLIR